MIYLLIYCLLYMLISIKQNPTTIIQIATQIFNFLHVFLFVYFRILLFENTFSKHIFECYNSNFVISNRSNIVLPVIEFRLEYSHHAYYNIFCREKCSIKLNLLQGKGSSLLLKIQPPPLNLGPPSKSGKGSPQVSSRILAPPLN